MSFITITCSCGHSDDFDAFTRTPLSGDLPPNHFQCPRCFTAWKRIESGHRLLRHGTAMTVIAGKVEVVSVEGRL